MKYGVTDFIRNEWHVKIVPGMLEYQHDGGLQLNYSGRRTSKSERTIVYQTKFWRKNTGKLPRVRRYMQVMESMCVMFALCSCVRNNIEKYFCIEVF